MIVNLHVVWLSKAHHHQRHLQTFDAKLGTSYIFHMICKFAFVVHFCISSGDLEGTWFNVAFFFWGGGGQHFGRGCAARFSKP